MKNFLSNLIPSLTRGAVGTNEQKATVGFFSGQHKKEKNPTKKQLKKINEGLNDLAKENEEFFGGEGSVIR